MTSVPELFGSMVFNDAVMHERLPKETYKALRKTIQDGKTLDIAVANVVANAISWLLVAPGLDILIYAEPADKVFLQGAFAAIVNSLTAVIVGGLLVAAFCKTIAKKGSLDKE